MRKKGIKIITAFIIIFLIITNPDMKVFKEYVGVRQTSVNVKRNYNFIIFSMYQYTYEESTGVEEYTYKKYYLGIAANFFPVKTFVNKVAL